MKTVSELQQRLLIVESKIKKLEGASYSTDAVSKSFHLGRVGSGRNTHSLNKRRERDLERTIDNAVAIQPLYRERDLLNRQIASLDSVAVFKREEKEKALIEHLVNYWNNIKVGDKIDIGGNSLVTVTKKTKKSLYTGAECKMVGSRNYR